MQGHGSPWRDPHGSELPAPAATGVPGPQREGGPAGSYPVAGVERGEEHERAGAGHVERAVPRAQELRPQEPAGGHGRLGGLSTAAPTPDPAAPVQPPPRAGAR